MSCRPSAVLLRNIETLFKGPAGFAGSRRRNFDQLKIIPFIFFAIISTY